MPKTDYPENIMKLVKVVSNIQNNNGRICVESPGLGKGSTFYFVLSIKQPLIKKQHLKKPRKLPKTYTLSQSKKLSCSLTIYAAHINLLR